MVKLTAAARRERLRNAERLRHLVRRTRPLSALTGVSLSWRAMLLAGTMLSAQAALAQSTKLPQGGQVVAGGAAIAQPTANQMVITQSTQRAAINWQSFNIGSGYGVQFVQPSSSAIAVNRVIGLGGPSQILGSLTANGQVYIVNPQGVVFGRGSVVNTGALVATTRDLDLQQFASGGNITLAGGSTGNGAVVNKGTITTGAGGYVVLAGDRVVNKGTIDTPGGRTVLAAGDQATVALSNGQLVNVTMNASVANATVKNGGVIKAAGGKVVLSANGANSVLGGAVNLTGSVDVSAALAGDITVDAGPGGTVNATGAKLNAVSTAGKGGNITLAGDRVGMFEGTKLNASGTTGGGTVLAGGGVQGKDATVRNASVTVLDPSSSIDASATDKGDGGTVVLWSQDYTGFYGTILARGGANGGNGGWVETSSHDNLQAWGSVRAGAVLGHGGSWLLDPTDVTIANSSNVNATDNATGSWAVSGATATINANSVAADLADGLAVTITTASLGASAGNITIAANIIKSSGKNDASLTLTANGTITDNGATISSTSGKLDVTMTGSKTVTLADGTVFSLNGGALAISGGTTTNGGTGVLLSNVTISAASATITGTSNAALAVSMLGFLSAADTPALLITGTSVNGKASDAVDVFSNITAANLTIVGNATGLGGLGLSIHSSTTVSGNLTLNGSGTGENGGAGGGVLLNASSLTSNGGSIALIGSSSAGYGVSLNASVLNAAANLAINGTSPAGEGVRFVNCVSFIAPTAAVNGTTTTGTFGINIPSTATSLDLSGVSSLTINGTGGSNAAVYLGRAVTVGSLTVNGNSNTGSGVRLGGDVTTTAGDIIVIGTSNTGTAVCLSGAVTLNAGNHSVTFSGTSVAGNGFDSTSNLTVVASNATFIGCTTNGAYGANFSSRPVLTGVTSLTITGTGGTTAAVLWNNSAVLSNTSAVSITGNNSGSSSGAGVILNSSLTANGTLTVNGSAGGSGNGVTVNSSFLASCSSFVAITGTSNVGMGVAMGGGILQAAQGATVCGTSISNVGVSLANTTIKSNASNAAVGSVDLVGPSGGLQQPSLIITGSSTSGDGVRIANATLNACATTAAADSIDVGTSLTLSTPLVITGTSDSGIGVNIALGNYSAPSGTITGTTNTGANAVLINGLNATNVPSLTIGGTGGSNFAVTLSGALNVAGLTVLGCTTTANAGGIWLNSSLPASGDVTLNGSGAKSGVTVCTSCVTGLKILAAGSVVVTGSGGTGDGIFVSAVNATINSTGGTVTLNGGSNTAIGLNLACASNNTSLILAGSSATLTGTANTGSSAVAIGGLNASNVANLTVNGSGGVSYSVSLTRNISAANLTVVGGNAFGGIQQNATVTATGNVTLNGSVGTSFVGVAVSGSMTAGNLTIVGAATNATVNSLAVQVVGASLTASNGSIVLNGSANGGIGVCVSAGMSISGPPLNMIFTIPTTVTAGCVTIVGSSNTSKGVDIDFCTTVTGKTVVISGTSTSNVGVTINSATIAGNGTGSTTVNANSLSMNFACFTGNGNSVVLQAINTAAPMTVSGNGVSFNNVASVAFGGANQAGDLNYAVNSTYRGAGNFSITTGAANITLNGNINASQGTGSVRLQAGSGVPLNSSEGAGNVTGGDVIVGSATMIAPGSCGTVVIWSGNDRTASYQPLVNGSASSFLVTCGTLAGAGTVNGSVALNLFYRLSLTPTVEVILGNLTGVSLTKGYDGIGVGLGYSVVMLGTNDTAPTVTMLGNLSSDTLLTGGLAQHAGIYTISQGNATFSYSGNYALKVLNGTITITQAPLSVNATSDTKTYDGTFSSSAAPSVIGAVAGDVFKPASQGFTNFHALGTGNSTLAAIALTNASFANSTTGSYITDYNVSYTSASGTITPKALTVTATSDSKTYDRGVGSAVLATVCGTIAGDSFSNASLVQVFNSSHALGTNGSTLNVAAALNANSFATSNAGLSGLVSPSGGASAGSLITDYCVSYVTANGTITPKALTVTATTDTKVYDGTTSSTALATVSGNIAGDSFTNASLAEAFNSSHALGVNGSTLNVAGPLTNASIISTVGCSGVGISCTAAVSSNGSWITDYNVTYATTTGTITPKALTVTASGASKTYDGTTSAGGCVSVNGTIAGDSFQASALTQAFNSSHVLGTNGSTVNVAAALGNASFAGSTANSAISDYNVSYVTANGTITPKSLTVTAAGGAKAYDGTTGSNISASVCGTIAGDSFNAACLSEVFNTTHAGSATLTLVGGILTNASFANSTAGSFITDYNVSYGAATANGTITRAPLVVTATSDSKIYDGTINSSATPTLNGAIAGDTFNVSTLRQFYCSSHALGTGNSTLGLTGTVNLTSSNVGSLATDYCVSYAGNNGTITPKALTVTASTDIKTYDGTVSSNATATVCGTIAGDSFKATALAEVFNSSHALGANGSTLNVAAALSNASFATTVGNESLACLSSPASCGSFITDYNVTYVTANGTITPKALTVTASGASKIYDGTTAASGCVSVSGALEGDTFKLANLAQAFVGSHALGANGSTVNIATALSNASFANSTANSAISDYNVSYVTANGTITPAPLTVTASSGTKVYDGTTASNATATVCGTIAGDSFTNASLAETYNSSHALGANASRLNVAAALANASFASNTTGSVITDYNVSYVTANGTITKATLTVTAGTDTKTYDGTTSSTAKPTATSGVAGDTFNTANVTETFGSKHALGEGNSTLNVTGGSLLIVSNVGSTATDYAVVLVGATGTITPKALTVTANSGTKGYDGTLSSTALATVSGNIAGDSFTNASLAEVYNNSHVLGTNGSTLNVATPLTNASFATTGCITGLVDTSAAPPNNGSFITDYCISYVTANGTITPRALTVTASSVTRTYDGTTVASGCVSVNGTIEGDSFKAANLTQVFASSHALGANGSTLNVATALTNASFANGSPSFIGDYSVSYVTASGTITPAPLTVTASSGTKTYDGVTASNATATACGTIAGDSFTNASLAETYNSSHVLGANGSTLNVATALTNASFASNTAGSIITDYCVSYVSANGTITAKALTVTAGTDTKTYDGNLLSTVLATVSGNIAGDSFTNVALRQTYGSIHALGAGNSTLNVAAPLANASFASNTAGSLITDYCVSYTTAPGTITPRALTVTATSGTKTYDGTTSSTALATVSGNIAGDSFTNASLAEVYNNSHVLGANGSTLNVAGPLTNASFATTGNPDTIGASQAVRGSFITDYNVSYVAAQGTITPRALTVTASSVTRTYDGTTVASGCVSVNGTIEGDTFKAANLTQVFASSHALGANISTLNIAAALTNASFANSTANSAISDYSVSYVTANGTITPKALTVTAGTATKVYDGTTSANATATVNGTIAGDSFTNASLAETYASIHALGTGNSTLNAAAPLTNASFANSSAGSRITDYNVSYVTAAGTITPKALAVNATTDTKLFDGSTSSTALMTVNGTIAGDSFTNASLAQVYAVPVAAGSGNSILLPAAPLTNASFATSTAGSFITDYSITYTAALGTITPLPVTNTGTTIVIPPPNQIDGTASSAVVSLGSWLNSGGLQQNMPSGLALNDNVMHLFFTTSSTGQPLIQASWAFFNSAYSGTINLPVNVNNPTP